MTSKISTQMARFQGKVSKFDYRRGVVYKLRIERVTLGFFDKMADMIATVPTPVIKVWRQFEDGTYYNYLPYFSEEEFVADWKTGALR